MAHTLTTAQERDALTALLATALHANNDPIVIGRRYAAIYDNLASVGAITRDVADAFIEHGREFLGQMFAVLVEADMEATAS